MNALVNSQYESLKRLSHNYTERTGNEFPVRFEKYTGQEGKETKDRIQRNPPHILLTNYVMLELMLVRPQERNFVDKTTNALQFLVFDELHTYRGRQGADVGLLIRRLRERWIVHFLASGPAPPWFLTESSPRKDEKRLLIMPSTIWSKN